MPFTPCSFDCDGDEKMFARASCVFPDSKTERIRCSRGATRISFAPGGKAVRVHHISDGGNVSDE